ncbi:MAG: ATP-binding protein [candidate division WOR-3 bacterium]|nr:ATP-binding protein [candidate division WOR-3 bacterium]
MLLHLAIIHRNLKEIILYVKSLLNENYSSRIIRKAKGNFAELIRILNELTEKMEKQKVNSGEKGDVLAILFEVMKEGVILTKKSGEIIQANKSIKEIFGENIVKAGKMIQELMVNKDFIDFVNKNPEEGKIDVIELHQPETGKYLLISRLFLEQYQLFIYLFSDITDTKNLARVKSEFITNLSHELRTPLTAIKGYLEVLDEGGLDGKDKKKFIKILRGNIERLVNIVSDLLILSDVERTERKLDVEKFDLNGVVDEIVMLFRKSAEEKGLQLVYTPAKIPLYSGDRFLIQQLLVNLVSNGIRFTEKGKVEIEIKYEGKKFLITVSDTGIGIPAEEIPKIFERFYTVDKARSRAQGGTGLGLSIVKHIVQLHQGEIKVESRLREGSRFTVILPDMSASSF